MNRRFLPVITLVLVLLVLSGRITVVRAEAGKRPLNVDKAGVILRGYDPVAYFTEGRPVKGEARFASTHDGATYHFVSAEHKAAFDASPSKYAVQFGGYCGYAVSRGYTADIDPRQFVIVDGRLVLQYSAKALRLFNEDAAANLKKADSNWPKIVENKGK